MRKIKSKLFKRNVLMFFALFVFCVSYFLLNIKTGYSLPEETHNLPSTISLDDGLYAAKDKTLNPEWITYKNASEEEKLKYQLIPDVYLEDNDVYDLKNIYEQTDSVYGASASDASYNLASHNLTLPNRNQSTSGLCWAFASLSTIEGNMLKLGLHSYSSPKRLSPRQLDYASIVAKHTTENYNPYANSYRTSLYTSGAYTSTPFLLFDSGIAPVVEDGSKWGWNSSTTARSLNDTINVNNVSYYVTDMAKYGSQPYSSSRTGTDAWIQKIKQHIINYGEAAVGTIGPNSTYGGSCVYTDSNGIVLINKNGACNSAAGDANSGHSMVIIGWDDNYTYSYCRGNNYTSSNLSGCANIVSGKGAFILKNSWGTSVAYPRLAYSSYIDYVYGAIKTQAKNWNINYDRTKPRSLNKTAANTYEARYRKGSATEVLKKVTWRSDYANDNYSVYVKDGSGSFQLVKSGITRNSAGTFSADVNVTLTGTDFTVKVVTSGGTVSDINAFAAYSAVDGNIRIDTIVPTGIINYSTSFWIYSATRNVPTGAIITYKVTAANGADYSSIVKFANNYNINGICSPLASISSKLSTTAITIKTYYNGVLYDTDTISVASETGLWASGTGSSSDPFIIKTATDFQNIFTSEVYLGSHFKLANDISFSGVTYNPGTQVGPLSGTIDGAGHTIYNLTVNSAYASLIKEIRGGTVKNLNVANSTFTNSNGSYLGVIAATASGAEISNVVVAKTVTINGNFDFMGGIVGFSRSGLIQNVANHANVSNSSAAQDYTGGIVAYSEGTYYKQVYNTGNVNGTATVSGGIAGRLEVENETSYNYMEYVYNHGNVTSTFFHGGLNGYDAASTVQYAYVLTTKSSQTEYFGHVVGGSLGVTYYYIYYPTSVNNPAYADDGTSSVGSFAAKTDAQLKTQAGYPSFNFNTIWMMRNNYPAFKSFYFVPSTSITASNVTVNKNKTKTISYSVSPAGSTISGVSFTSSNANIAKVDSTGKVTGVSKGSTTIKLTALDGSGVTKTINVEVTDVSLDFGNLTVDEDKNYILDLNPGTQVKTITNEITTGGTVTVTNSGGTALSSTTKVSTGSKVNIVISGTTYRYTVVVKGDVTGKGVVTMASVMKIADYLFDKNVITEGYYLEAADVTGDGNITMSDVMKLANSLF